MKHLPKRQAWVDRCKAEGITLEHTELNRKLKVEMFLSEKTAESSKAFREADEQFRWHIDKEKKYPLKNSRGGRGGGYDHFHPFSQGHR